MTLHVSDKQAATEPSIPRQDDRAIGVDGSLATQTRLLAMIGGFRLSQAIYVAAKLGIADLLAEGPRRAGELARLTDTHPQALYRLLRALAGAGIFSEDDSSCFSLTPTGAFLRRDVDGSLHGQASLMGEPWVWGSFGELLESIRTGQPAFDRLYGAGFWDYLAASDERAASFDAAMTDLSSMEIDALLAAYGLDGATAVADIGGGRGALLAAILATHPTTRGMLIELPAVVDGARELLEQAGVSARCQVIAGDMFTAITPGADLYILKRVIHDWNDDQAVVILRRCREAMDDHARLLLAEPMITPGNTPHPAKLLDLQMLVAQKGRERTATEFAELLDTAGFELLRTIPTSFLLTLIEAKPNLNHAD